MRPIELTDFCIHLRERTTFKKTSFAIESGTASVIMGPTGTGKSVFLKSIAGILPMNIFKFEGSMKVNGIDAYIDGNKLDYTQWTKIEQSGLMFIPAETAQVMNMAL
jgi:ABC-type multidrug transport system ATPase subunit